MNAGTLKVRDGFAVTVVILGILVLGVLGMTMLKVGGDEMSASHATRVSTSALFAADAGVRATLINWPGAAASLTAGDSMVDASWTTLANGAAYRRTIHRRDAGSGTQVFAVTVEGRTAGPRGGEAAVQVWLSSSPSRFMGAVSSRTNATISSSGYTDSYHSGLGDYGGTNVEPTGHVLVNGNLSITGSAQVRGDAVTGSYSNSGNGTTGTITTGAAPVSYPQEPCPSGPFSAFPAQPGVSYNQSTGKLSTGDSLVINTSGTYYFSEVTLSGGAQMIIPAGVTVKLYISSKFTTSGGGGLNNRGKLASDLSLISCGTGTQAWSLSGGSNAYFTIYAPNNKVTLSGNSPVFGAIVAGEFVSSGGSPIHFDRALLGGGATPNLVARSWHQVLR
jgi:hypothetical protein